jgi:hypothetical protein
MTDHANKNTKGASNTSGTSGKSDKTSMSAKYCDHYHTHGCTKIVAANVKLCDDCKKGNC